jgi:hypothetical protein
MLFNCRAYVISNPFGIRPATFFGQSRPIVFSTNLLVVIGPFSQTLCLGSAWLSVIDINVDVGPRMSIIAPRVTFVVMVNICSIVIPYRNKVYIVHRIGPSDVVVVIRDIVDWPVVEVKICVVIPRTPFVGTDVSIDNTNLRLMAIC